MQGLSYYCAITLYLHKEYRQCIYHLTESPRSIWASEARAGKWSRETETHLKNEVQCVVLCLKDLAFENNKYLTTKVKKKNKNNSLKYRCKRNARALG